MNNRIDGKPFTCENARFATKESVLADPLVDEGPYSLRLERVTDKKGGADAFWLMWYDQEGTPTIPLSGVISEDKLREMVGKLTEFIKLP